MAVTDRPTASGAGGPEAATRAFWQITPRTYRVVTLLALVALGFIVVTGAGVRLTGSGLGCSDWPTCEENQFVAAMDQPHAVIEFLNRTITGLVSVAVIVAVLGSLARVPRRTDLTWWSLGLVAGIVGQIVLGGITVKFHLWPPLVMGHYLLSAVLVWNAVVLHHKAGQPEGRPRPVVDRRTVRLGRLTCAAAVVVLVTGTVVTGSGPHGGDQDVARLGFSVPAVVRNHSASAWVLLALVVATLAVAYRQRPQPAGLRRRGALVTAAVVAQGAVGYLQYATGVPVALVGLHVLGSVLVWVAVVELHLGLFAVPPAGDDAGPVPASTTAAA